MTTTEPIRDWRGTEITPGRTVVYGGPVGRSIQQVEGVVDGFTKSGRVRVRVVRRSYTCGSKEIVDVGADRLTVVDALPPTTVRTQSEEHAEHVERERVRATHTFPPYWDPRPGFYGKNPEAGGPCRTCGLPFEERYDKECTS